MIEKNIREILTQLLKIDVIIIRSDDLLSEHDLDSILFIKFIILLEEKFRIVIRDSDLIHKNFKTINMCISTISKYIEVDCYE
ncbi:MAG: hypothetical protein A2Y17_00705 [Clostridiales bacterium GWF2_38_85]|nr:MAG: hypothetical protein A2Y17_00705 [Clostridiales bacterium GWF2_38_85]